MTKTVPGDGDDAAMMGVSVEGLDIWHGQHAKGVSFGNQTVKKEKQRGYISGLYVKCSVQMGDRLRGSGFFV